MKTGKDRQQEEVATGRYKRATEERLILGGFALVLVVGGGLTTLFLGLGSAAVAIAVVALATGLLLLLYMALGSLEGWLKR